MFIFLQGENMIYRRRLRLDLETWFKMNSGMRKKKIMMSGNGFKVIVSNHMTLMK